MAVLQPESNHSSEPPRYTDARWKNNQPLKQAKHVKRIDVVLSVAHVTQCYTYITYYQFSSYSFNFSMFRWSFTRVQRCQSHSSPLCPEVQQQPCYLKVFLLRRLDRRFSSTEKASVNATQPLPQYPQYPQYPQHCRSRSSTSTCSCSSLQ